MGQQTKFVVLGEISKVYLLVVFDIDCRRMWIVFRHLNP